ncbi:MAG: radical SAM protein [Myxococcota bacterium]
MDAHPEISDWQRTEARTVTGNLSGHQFELQLGHLCNNRCVFCDSGWLTELGFATPVEFQDILDAMDGARRDGATRLVFLGGEPTLHRGFLPALKRGVELGFEEIVIFTNGVRLPQRKFVDPILKLGRFTWRISIQGADEDSHVAVTRRTQSFRRIMEGIEYLRRHGQRITSNICVNERSYRSLPKFPDLVARTGIRQLHIDIIRPSSVGNRGQEYLRSIMPRYSDMAPYYAEMFERFEREQPGFEVDAGNLPYCVLPEWANRIHHGGEATVIQSTTPEGFEEAGDKYAIHRSQRRFLDRCGECVFRTKCTGIFRDYLAIYGDEEFQPVSRERLRAIDPGLTSFTLLVEPYLRPLYDAYAGGDAPEGWRPVEAFEDDRNRRVHFAWTTDAGAGVTLHVTPPEGVGRPVNAPPSAFETDRYRVAPLVDGLVPPEDLRRLLTWATDRLSAAPGVTVTRPLASGDIDSLAGRDEAALARSRARLRRVVGRLQRKREFCAWHFSGLSLLPEGRGAICQVRGPGGLGVDLVVEVGARDGRSRVDARFEVCDGTDEHLARPVIEEIVRTIRT